MRAIFLMCVFLNVGSAFAATCSANGSFRGFNLYPAGMAGGCDQRPEGAVCGTVGVLEWNPKRGMCVRINAANDCTCVRTEGIYDEAADKANKMAERAY